MKGMLDKYREWSRKREERGFAKWAKTRQKGKSYIVSGYALFYSVGTSLALVLSRYLFDEPQDIATFTIQLLILFLFGLGLGLYTWRSQEKKYLQYQLLEGKGDI